LGEKGQENWETRRKPRGEKKKRQLKQEQSGDRGLGERGRERVGARPISKLQGRGVSEQKKRRHGIDRGTSKN